MDDKKKKASKDGGKSGGKGGGRGGGRGGGKGGVKGRPPVDNIDVLPDRPLTQLNKALLSDIIDDQGSGSVPKCNGFTMLNHFNALEQYAGSVPKQYWRNLIASQEKAEGGVVKYREIYTRMPGVTFADLPTSNFFSMWERWVSNKFIRLQDCQFKPEQRSLKEKDQYRFLYFTVGYLVKCYNNQCQGHGSINTVQRGQVLGSDLIKVYQLAKKASPELWRLKLLSRSDRRLNELDVSDEEGERLFDPEGHRSSQKVPRNEEQQSDGDSGSEIGIGETSDTYGDKIKRKKSQIANTKSEKLAFEKKVSNLDITLDTERMSLKLLRKKKKKCQLREAVWTNLNLAPEPVVKKFADKDIAWDDHWAAHIRMAEFMEASGLSSSKIEDVVSFLIDNCKVEGPNFQKEFAASQMQQPTSSSRLKLNKDGVIVGDKNVPDVSKASGKTRKRALETVSSDLEYTQPPTKSTKMELMKMRAESLQSEKKVLSLQDYKLRNLPLLPTRKADLPKKYQKSALSEDESEDDDAGKAEAEEGAEPSTEIADSDSDGEVEGEEGSATNSVVEGSAAEEDENRETEAEFSEDEEVIISNKKGVKRREINSEDDGSASEHDSETSKLQGDVLNEAGDEIINHEDEQSIIADDSQAEPKYDDMPDIAANVTVESAEDNAEVIQSTPDSDPVSQAGRISALRQTLNNPPKKAE